MARSQATLRGATSDRSKTVDPAVVTLILNATHGQSLAVDRAQLTQSIMAPDVPQRPCAARRWQACGTRPVALEPEPTGRLSYVPRAFECLAGCSSYKFKAKVVHLPPR